LIHKGGYSSCKLILSATTDGRCKVKLEQGGHILEVDENDLEKVRISPYLFYECACGKFSLASARPGVSNRGEGHIVNFSLSWEPQHQYFSNYFIPNSHESLHNEVPIITADCMFYSMRTVEHLSKKYTCLDLHNWIGLF